MSNHQLAWDELINMRIQDITGSIAAITAEKNSVDARILKFSGSSDANVVDLCSKLQLKTAILEQSLAYHVAKLPMLQNRLYAALSPTLQTLVDEMCGCKDTRIKNLFADPNIDIELAAANITAAKQSLSDPDCLECEDCAELYFTVLRRMLG